MTVHINIHTYQNLKRTHKITYRLHRYSRDNCFIANRQRECLCDIHTHSFWLDPRERNRVFNINQ